MAHQTIDEMIEVLEAFRRDGKVDMYSIDGKFIQELKNPFWGFNLYIYKPHFKHRQMKEEFETNRDKYSHVEYFSERCSNWLGLGNYGINWLNKYQYRLVEKKPKDIFDDYEPFEYRDALMFMCKPIQNETKDIITSFISFDKDNIAIVISYFENRWTFIETGLPFGKLKKN